VQGLLNDGFRAVQNLYDNEAITDNSKYVGVLKRESSCIYAVVAVNTDNEEHYSQIFEQVSRFLKQQFSVSQNSKLILTGIFVSKVPDEKLRNFCTLEIEDFDGSYTELRWIADVEKGKRDICGYQPSEVANIGKIADGAFKGDASPSTLRDMSGRAAATEFERIKSRGNIITLILLAVNLVVFAAMELAGGSTNTNVLLDFGALDSALVKSGQWYRLFTCMFLHIGIAHLLANGLSLYILGSRIEKYYGRIWFIIVYIISGIVASCTSLMFSDAVSAGASGAIFGLMGAMLVYTLIVGKNMDGFDLQLTAIFAVVSIGAGALMVNVDNYAHLGGFVSGMIISALPAYMIKRKLK
jgi:membrane associated rhomboid family serine protease